MSFGFHALSLPPLVNFNLLCMLLFLVFCLLCLLSLTWHLPASAWLLACWSTISLHHLDLFLSFPYIHSFPYLSFFQSLSFVTAPQSAFCRQQQKGRIKISKVPSSILPTWTTKGTRNTHCTKKGATAKHQELKTLFPKNSEFPWSNDIIKFTQYTQHTPLILHNTSTTILFSSASIGFSIYFQHSFKLSSILSEEHHTWILQSEES